MGTLSNVASARGRRALPLAGCLLGLCVLAGACNSSTPPASNGTQGGEAGGGDNGGSGGAAGAAGSAGPSGGKGGSSPTADASAPADGPLAGAGGSGGSTGGAGGSGGAPEGKDAPVEKPTSADAGGADGIPDSDFLPGRPDIRLCKKEWTMEQCCAFLCSCLNTICADSAKAKPGLASCMTWCPKISSMAARCHVYHCYVSISPTGGIKDHDSHCGHAANQVAGGGCPTAAYQ